MSAVASVTLESDTLVVNYPLELDGHTVREAIGLRDTIEVVLERGSGADGNDIVHWFVRHRDGWTLHFNETFRGAADVAMQLQVRLGFAAPAPDQIAGPGGNGTIVWSATRKS